jgi:hypothetical protein
LSRHATRKAIFTANSAPQITPVSSGRQFQYTSATRNMAIEVITITRDTARP